MVKLSIVIPYYKTYELTTKIFEKIIPQMKDNNSVELIVIDDGCNEKNFDKYDDENENVYVIHFENNRGGASASNMGISMASGKYIGFIDSDDMISDDYIETLLDAIDNHNEDVLFMDWQDMGSGMVIHHPNNYAPWKAIYKKDIIPNFPDGQKFSYDVPFYDRLNSKPYSKYYIDKVLYYYNSQREDNLTHLKEKERIKNMIKCEVIENFSLEKFDELKEVVRKHNGVKGMLYVGDTFKCDKEMADYLLGNNALKRAFVKVIEVEPKEVVKEEKPKKKKGKK